jgi:Mce-associated membrane protein
MRSGIGRVTVALAVLLGSGVSAAAQEDDARGPSNHALVDTAGTTEVLVRAKEVSEQLFSYNYVDLDSHKRKFAELTTGEFADRYSELFDEVVAQAPAMKLVMTSTVKDAGVRVLRGDRAEVLVFLDQNGTRGDTGAGSQTFAQAMFVATLQRVDGDWKVADLDAFEGS